VAPGASLNHPCIEQFPPNPDLAQTAILLGAQGVEVKQRLEPLERQLDLPPFLMEVGDALAIARELIANRSSAGQEAALAEKDGVQPKAICVIF
jgi:hypothetical protein